MTSKPMPSALDEPPVVAEDAVPTRLNPLDQTAASTAGADGSRREPAPTGSNRRRQHRPPRDHAVALLEYLLGSEFDRRTYLSSEDMQDVHLALCEELGWWPRPWAPVARQYRLLANNDRRIYANLAIDGKVCKVRIYYLPQGLGHALP